MDFSSNIDAVLPECPHCHMFDRTFYFVKQMNSPHKNNFVSFWVCGHCNGGVVCETEMRIDEHIPRTYDVNDFIKIFPDSESYRAPKYTPLDIASDFEEAKKSLIIGNLKAACIMAGNTLETVCISYGAVENGLGGKIKKLRNQGLITESLADWAGEIKSFRDTAAHHAEREARGLFSEIDKKDAEQIIYFTEMLLTYLYTLPGMIAEHRSRS